MIGWRLSEVIEKLSFWEWQTMVVRNNNFSIKGNKLIKYPHILSKFIPTFTPKMR